MDENEQMVELPPLSPALKQFLDQMKGDRKKLLKDKAFTDPAQLRSFIGQFLYPRLFEMFEMIAGAGQDTYQLAYSNMTQGKRMHAFMVEELQRMGSDVSHGDSLPGIDTESLDQFQQSFYTLGALLMKKLPDDKEMEGAWNTCVTFLDEVMDSFMGGGSYVEDEASPSSDENEDIEDIEDGADDVIPPREESPPEEEPEAEPEEPPVVEDELPAEEGGES